MTWLRSLFSSSSCFDVVQSTRNECRLICQAAFSVGTALASLSTLTPLPFSLLFSEVACVVMCRMRCAYCCIAAICFDQQRAAVSELDLESCVMAVSN